MSFDQSRAFRKTGLMALVMIWFCLLVYCSSLNLWSLSQKTFLEVKYRKARRNSICNLYFIKHGHGVNTDIGLRRVWPSKGCLVMYSGMMTYLSLSIKQLCYPLYLSPSPTDFAVFTSGQVRSAVATHLSAIRKYPGIYLWQTGPNDL